MASEWVRLRSELQKIIKMQEGVIEARAKLTERDLNALVHDIAIVGVMEKRKQIEKELSEIKEVPLTDIWDDETLTHEERHRITSAHIREIRWDGKDFIEVDIRPESLPSDHPARSSKELYVTVRIVETPDGPKLV